MEEMQVSNGGTVQRREKRSKSVESYSKEDVNKRDDSFPGRNSQGRAVLAPREGGTQRYGRS